MSEIGQNDGTGKNGGVYPQSHIGDMSGRVRQFAALLAAVVCLFAAAAAQTDGPEIRIDTKLAVFEVSVTDQKGQPVRGLTPQDFRVFENGTERPIDFFQPIKTRDTDRPLSIVFALDVSGSMTETELAKLRGALQEFVNRLADYESHFAIVSFAMDVDTVQSFTNRKEQLQKAFERVKRDQDGLSTHAFDAIDHSVRLIDRKGPRAVRNKFPRRAVIVITDGFPVGDVVSPQTVIERANAAETSVYTVLLPSYSRIQRDGRRIYTPLEASGVSDRTGGLSVVASESNFKAIFDSLAEELTASYAIAIYPGSEQQAGVQNVRIESKKGFTVRQNRNGYMNAN
jgi:VWFA-related protein